MSKGLGKMEHKIIEVLGYEYNKSQRENVYFGDLVYQVVNGVGCFHSNNNLLTPTNSQTQSTYRSIQSLEKKGILEIKREKVNFLNRCYRGDNLKRVIVTLKCLIHSINGANSTLKEGV